ncbi:CaiB/BaiF CoA transferase family protein [Amaricoccus solimangrovi]|uniref:CoA transferase n=1 Tax=Amaricoccus solimangrovi TaxID=2589815 RepID=A0A501WMZ0_9RHOB|nr:CoA transferase [Amaricoccus solimangrovi]TPE47106.1 CoA transferase [Amaricoccus solimangrovi]
MAGLLEGVTVLDLSAVISGPLCSYQFAMLGAEVIKVEPPARGDLARSLGADARLNAEGMGVSFLATNAGKKSVALDLKTEAGIAALERLVAASDVLIENFRPGTMARLKFDYDRARAIRPDLVWCSISGFGQSGPLAERQAYDQIIQGYCGLMSLTGDQETAPMRSGFQVCDTLAAITAAFAICAALYNRQRTGEGEFIDVSMLDSSLASLTSWPASGLLNAGKVPKPMGNENAASSPSGAFRAADGLVNIVANDQKQYHGLCDALGAPELKSDPRFHDRPARVVNRRELRALLEEKLASRTAGDWVEILTRANVPAGPILDLAGAMAHPQIAAREMIKTFDASAIGRPFSVSRLGFTLRGDLPDVALPPPRLGEHTDEVLRSVGCSEQEIERLSGGGETRRAS